MNTAARDSARELMARSLAGSGLLLDMQASYMQKVCDAASGSNHECFAESVKLPKSRAQEIAAEVALQYIAQKRMIHCEKAIASESRQKFVKKHDSDWLSSELQTDAPKNIIHQLIHRAFNNRANSPPQKTSSVEAKFKEISSADTIASHSISSIKEQVRAAVSRDVQHEDDTTIGQGPATDTTGAGAEQKRPWKIPPKKPVRSTNKSKFVRPPTIVSGNGNETVTVTTGTITTGTITPPTDETFSTEGEPEVIVEKVVKKVKKQKPVKVNQEEEVQVTLTLDETQSSYSTRSGEKQKSAEPSYTITYATVNPAQPTQDQQQQQQNYTYSFETMTVPNPTETVDSTKAETIQSTDSFQSPLEKQRKSSAAAKPKKSNASVSTGEHSHHSKHSDISIPSQKRSKHSSRVSTQTGNDEPVSQHSTASHSHHSTNSGVKDRDVGNEPLSRESTASRSSKRSSSKPDYSTQKTSGASSRKQAPPPSLPQPGSTSNYTSSSQDTYHKLMKKSPLGEILAQQDANGGVPSAPSQAPSNPTSGSISVHVISQTGSKKSSNTSSSVPDLDSSTLGDVNNDDNEFKSDSVNSEKMASDKELWQKK